MIVFKRLSSHGKREHKQEEKYIEQAKQKLRNMPPWCAPSEEDLSHRHFRAYLRWDTETDKPILNKNGKPIIEVFDDESIIQLLSEEKMYLSTDLSVAN